MTSMMEEMVTTDGTELRPGAVVCQGGAKQGKDLLRDEIWTTALNL